MAPLFKIPVWPLLSGYEMAGGRRLCQLLGYGVIKTGFLIDCFTAKTIVIWNVLALCYNPFEVPFLSEMKWSVFGQLYNVIQCTLNDKIIDHYPGVMVCSDANYMVYINLVAISLRTI